MPLGKQKWVKHLAAPREGTVQRSRVDLLKEKAGSESLCATKGVARRSGVAVDRRMDVLLSGYEVNPPTWFYLSLLLIVAVFFRFGRVWSLRNLDLILLLSISPGLLLVEPTLLDVRDPESSIKLQSWGHIWMYIGTGIILLRVFCDPLFRQRPKLEQNLNVAGLVFLSIAAFAFLMARVITEPPEPQAVEIAHLGEQLLSGKDTSSETKAAAGPTDTVVAAGADVIAKTVTAGNGSSASESEQIEPLAARIMAILAHIGVMAGLIVLGWRQFADATVGLAMATLYLLLPCTAFHVGIVNHVLPAALIVWAFVSYQRPIVAGGLMGLACGTFLFPVVLLLLPLWAAFYGWRGSIRFITALLSIGATVLLVTLIPTSADFASFTQQSLGFIDLSVFKFWGDKAAGSWNNLYHPAYLIPVGIAFLVMLIVLTIWPRRKNLEHLMSHSTAIVVATQLWYPQQESAYLLWYLPMMLMVVFRPRLTHLLPPEYDTSTSQNRQEPNATSPELSTTAAGGRLLR